MKVLRTLAAVALLFFALSSPLAAALTEPLITVVAADTTAGTLTIEGFNLPAGAVYIGKAGGGAQKLAVTSASATKVEASLPAGIAPGTYIVAIALSAEQFWTGTVTIGSQGVVTYFNEDGTALDFPAAATQHCAAGPHVAGAGETAMIHANMTFVDTAAQTGRIRVQFSTDGGTLWNDCNTYYVLQTSTAGGFANLAVSCTMALTEGTSYLFAIGADGFPAFTPSGGADCHNTVEIAKQ